MSYTLEFTKIALLDIENSECLAKEYANLGWGNLSILFG